MKRSIAESVAVIQVALDDLDPGAAVSDRAVAVAQLGFPVWFACQEQQGFVLAQAGGGRTADPERAFTTAVASLKSRNVAEGVNTVAMEVPHPSGGSERHVYNLRTKRVEPWTVYIYAGPKRSLSRAPVPSPRAARVIPDQPDILPLAQAIANLRGASDEFVGASERLAAAKAKEAALQNDQRTATEQASKITQGLSDRLAQDILAGRDIDDSQPETAKVRKLTTRANAISAALPLALAATCEAQAIVSHAGQIRSTAILDWAAAQQREAIEDTRASVRAMAPALATLAAVDRVKRQLFGKQIVTGHPGHPGLVSTERLAFKLINELPDRVRPQSLTSTTFEAAITEAVSAIKFNLGIDQ